MAAGNTYTPISTTTLGSAAASYTFTGISSSYTDLILVINGSASVAGNLWCRVGSGSLDTTSKYSALLMSGFPSSISNAIGLSDFTTALHFADIDTTQSLYVMNFMFYTNTSIWKHIISKGTRSDKTQFSGGIWGSTSAINQIQIYPNTGTLNAGTTLTLYGIAAA
jgi:hypothetical protein